MCTATGDGSSRPASSRRSWPGACGRRPSAEGGSAADDRGQLLAGACELSPALLERCRPDAVGLQEPELAHSLSDLREQLLHLGLVRHAASSSAGTSSVTCAACSFSCGSRTSALIA